VTAGLAAQLGALLPAPGEALLFAAAVLVLNATPGVDVLLTVSRTLQGGVRAGVAASAGINAGCVVHALAAAFGLAALLVLHPALFTAIQWAGATYLAWLGLGLLLEAWRGAGRAVSAEKAGRASTAGTAGTAPARPWWADVRTGLLTNLLNPKVALFFLAFLPQFVPAASPAPTLSFLLLGGWFVLQSSLFLLLLVLATAWLRGLGPSSGHPGFERVLQALGGVLFLGLALRLLRARPVAG
jgi:threonine/homoserine/homoserine lactone efflux protein